MPSHAPYFALYGTTRILKGYCQRCASYSFVIDGKIGCCDKPFEDVATKYKRECLPQQARKLPPRRERVACLRAQENRCLYCELEFGSYVTRKGHPIQLRLHWDHLVPYAYSQNNNGSNFAAACHVCNGIKSSHCFQTVEEARTFILARRADKGYL